MENRTAPPDVSIPQSGFGAFELVVINPHLIFPHFVSIPQSGFGAFEQPQHGRRLGRGAEVSIPQSGFGAFERCSFFTPPFGEFLFQSLSRDSGRLNQRQGRRGERLSVVVSIPQSGFGAFERNTSPPPLHLRPRFNPSVGIRGV